MNTKIDQTFWVLCARANPQMVSPLVPGAKLAMARGLQKVSHGGSGGCQLVCQLVYQSKKTTAEGRLEPASDSACKWFTLRPYFLSSGASWHGCCYAMSDMQGLHKSWGCLHSPPGNLAFSPATHLLELIESHDVRPCLTCRASANCARGAAFNSADFVMQLIYSVG